MLINAITNIAGVTSGSAITGTSALTSGATADSSPFSGVLKQAIESSQQLDSQAKQAVEGLMSGSGVDVHQAMIATQKADMAFEMMLSVRNKAVSAYQQLMSTQF